MNRKMLAMLVVWAVMIMGVCGAKAETTGWETDFGKASTNALKSGSYMMLDFSGSDWCGWCMKLDKEVFSKGEFKSFAKTNLVCVLVDFPREKHQSKKLKDQNAELAKKYGIRGYPTVIILSPKGDLVGQTGYQEGGAKKYVNDLKGMIEEFKKQQPRQEAEKKPIEGVPAMHKP